jgi:uncharacterized repeat protein (TIGR03803 family)
MKDRCVRSALLAIVVASLLVGPAAAQTAKNPQSAVVFGNDGYLYGTTASGGNSSYGTLFKLLPTGFGYNLLHSFDIVTDGNAPIGGLALDPVDGKFYGMTDGTYLTGGSNRPSTLYTLGSAPPNTFTNVAQMSFTGVSAKLTEVNGELYGTSVLNVFKMLKDGTILWSVQTPANGSPGLTGVTYGVDPSGVPWLFGASSFGGANNTGFVYKIHLDGSGLTVMKNFDAIVAGSSPSRNVNGLMPLAPPILYNGVLYGTAAGGGSYTACVAQTSVITGGYGTLYMIDLKTNAFQLLHTFTGASGPSSCGPPDDGRLPAASLVAATDCEGRPVLYGTTWLGGWYANYPLPPGVPAPLILEDKGTIYKITFDPVTQAPSYAGEVRVFAGQSKWTGSVWTPQEGSASQATLTRDPVLTNVFYGTTNNGGQHDTGTVFAWDSCNVSVRGSAFRWTYSF